MRFLCFPDRLFRIVKIEKEAKKADSVRRVLEFWLPSLSNSSSVTDLRVDKRIRKHATEKLRKTDKMKKSPQKQDIILIFQQLAKFSIITGSVGSWFNVENAKSVKPQADESKNLRSSNVE